MRRTSSRPCLFLVLFFLFVMSLPKGASEKIRSAVVCSFSPCWRSVSAFREKIPSLSPINLLEMERLAQENQLLRSQIEQVREWLLNEDRIQEQVQRYQDLSRAAIDEAFWKGFFKRRGQEMYRALELQICSLPAKVIFREPSSWSSTLWINLGENANEKLGKKIVGKNSPVLLGNSIIGVVEYVGTSQSRVRLITDSSLVPSVRSVRGNAQNRYLLDHLEALHFSLELREDLFGSSEARTLWMQLHHRLKAQLLQGSGDFYLAKGEIRGTSNPMWRSRAQVMKGTGFNYDFPDVEGPSRDLRSGEPYDPLRKKEAIPLLLPGDLLMTTGLDGIFPAGFRVAVVSKVESLKEGASSYAIEALSTAGSLDELTHVFVLPPLEMSGQRDRIK